MGVLNVTPDSFSDGGDYLDAEQAIAHGFEMVKQGADIVDVGGESTRPGAEPLDPSVEQARILPVVRALVVAGVTVSVDTLHAATARAAIEAGASIINDVSGGTVDPTIFTAVAGAQTAAGTPVKYVLGHWRGIPDLQHTRSTYTDVVWEVRAELAQQVAAAHAAGVTDEQLVIDPGLGFDKTAKQGWQLLARLGELFELGLPVMVGVSRKRMLGELLTDLDTELQQRFAKGFPNAPGADAASAAAREHTVEDRDLPTAVASSLAAQTGVWAIRVHEVHATRIALQVQRAWQEATS